MSLTPRTAGRAALCLALLVCIAVPAVAGDSILPGVDLWRTAGKNFTYSSFASDPLPADFFCMGSKPFTGQINLRGAPIATEPAGSLNEIDTIVRRLDTAVFDDQGVAHTRIQLMSLSLASIGPIQTECGAYDVAVRLVGEQPTTAMKIVRTSAAGGTYAAPLALNIQMVFTPVAGSGNAPRAITRSVALGPGDKSFWSATPPHYRGGGRVDTDGNGVADAALPHPSNFSAGVALAADSELCKDVSCHCTREELTRDPYEPNAHCDHLHCVDVLVPCDKPVPKIREGKPTTDTGTPTTSSSR
jgi:hypothetical protein